MSIESAPLDGTPALKRTVGPGQLTLYALGSMLGAGIYGLVGKAAGSVGNAVWLSFLVALVAALLTSLSYASLGSRHPRAGGAAYVTQRAFGRPLLSFVVGLALVCSGLTSVATQSRVFADNIAALLGLDGFPVWFFAVGFILILAALVFRGIRESMWVNVVCTLVEAGGLLMVVAAGIGYWGSVDYFAPPAGIEIDGAVMSLLIVQGAVLTFFAFIGFEDTINIAEECRNPQTTIPIALVAATLTAALIYVAIAITAVSVVPADELAASPSPLTEVMNRAAPSVPPIVYIAITLFAVANTALVNYVTASRLMFGMARQGLLPEPVGAVHASRRTPHIAVVLLMLVLLPLAIAGTVTALASATVLLLLVVFAIVNAALFVLQRRSGEVKGAFEVPPFVPLLGCIVCAGLIVVRLLSADWHAPAIAAALIAGIVAVYAWLRPTAVEAD